MAARYKVHNWTSVECDSEDDCEEITLVETKGKDPQNIKEEEILPKVEQEKHKCQESLAIQTSTTRAILWYSTSVQGHGYGCYSCTSKITIKDVRNIKPGQHLTRKGDKKIIGRLYSHHMLCTDIKHISKTKIRITVIHKLPKKEGEKNKDSTVRLDQFDLSNDDLKNQNYNIISYTSPKFSYQEIVTRAKNLLHDCENAEKKNNDDNDNSYNLLLKNCEHFVTYCTTGYDESKQVYNAFTKLMGLFKKGGSVPNSMVTLLNNLDEFGSLLTRTKIGLAVAIPATIIVLIWSVAKLIYTKSRKSLCRFCKKDKMKEYAIDILFVIGELGISLILMFVCSFVFWEALLVGIGIALGSLAVKKLITKILNTYFRPKFETTELMSCSALVPGDVVLYKYWGFDHVAIVVDIQKFDKEKTELSLIHYGLETLFAKRKIIEEKVTFSTNNPSLKMCNFFETPHFENDKVVERATSRLGETNWSPLKNTSYHFCHWCKVQNINIDIEKE